MNRRGVKPKHNREIISGIVHILKVGCRWLDCPEVYGPAPRSTIGSTDGRGTAFGKTMLEALADTGSAGSQSIDSTTSKARRCAAGEKGGAKAGDRPQPRWADDQGPRRCQRVRPFDCFRPHPLGRWATFARRQALSRGCRKPPCYWPTPPTTVISFANFWLLGALPIGTKISWHESN
jgi:transposase